MLDYLSESFQVSQNLLTNIYDRSIAPKVPAPLSRKKYYDPFKQRVTVLYKKGEMFGLNPKWEMKNFEISNFDLILRDLRGDQWSPAATNVSYYWPANSADDLANLCYVLFGYFDTNKELAIYYSQRQTVKIVNSGQGLENFGISNTEICLANA